MDNAEHQEAELISINVPMRPLTIAIALDMLARDNRDLVDRLHETSEELERVRAELLEMHREARAPEGQAIHDRTIRDLETMLDFVNKVAETDVISRSWAKRNLENIISRAREGRADEGG